MLQAHTIAAPLCVLKLVRLPILAGSPNCISDLGESLRLKNVAIVTAYFGLHELTTVSVLCVFAIIGERRQIAKSVLSPLSLLAPPAASDSAQASSSLSLTTPRVLVVTDSGRDLDDA